MGGSPFTMDEVNTARELIARGWTYARIAKKLRRSATGIARIGAGTSGAQYPVQPVAAPTAVTTYKRTPRSADSRTVELISAVCTAGYEADVALDLIKTILEATQRTQANSRRTYSNGQARNNGQGEDLSGLDRSEGNSPS